MKVCLFYSQNDNILLSNVAHIFEKFTRCAKVCGIFSWLCFSDVDWLGMPTSMKSHGVFGEQL